MTAISPATLPVTNTDASVSASEAQGSSPAREAMCGRMASTADAVPASSACTGRAKGVSLGGGGGAAGGSMDRGARRPGRCAHLVGRRLEPGSDGLGWAAAVENGDMKARFEGVVSGAKADDTTADFRALLLTWGFDANAGTVDEQLVQTYRHRN